VAGFYGPDFLIFYPDMDYPCFFKEKKMSQNSAADAVKSVIGKIALMHLDISSFHGTTRTPFEGVGEKDELYTPGALRLLDPKKLKWAPTRRAQAVRACLSVGTRFLGGYAIPEEKFKTLQAELKVVSDGYYKERQEFLDNLGTSVTDWANAHEDKKEEILRKRPDHAYVSRQLRCNVSAFRVSPEELEHGLVDGIESEVGSMSWNIACEVAQEVKDGWRPTGDASSQRIRTGLLRRIAVKAEGLSFISPKIERICTLIKQIDDTLPKEGPIIGRDFLALEGLMRLLGDPRKLLADVRLQVIVDDTPQLVSQKALEIISEPAPEATATVASPAPQQAPEEPAEAVTEGSGGAYSW